MFLVSLPLPHSLILQEDPCHYLPWVSWLPEEGRTSRVGQEA